MEGVKEGVKEVLMHKLMGVLDLNLLIMDQSLQLQQNCCLSRLNQCVTSMHGNKIAVIKMAMNDDGCVH